MLFTVAELLVITGRATAGIAITQQAILRFFAPQGRHDSPISVKFGMAEGTAGPPLPCQISHMNIWGFLAQKSDKLLKFPPFSPRRGKPLAHVDEIRKVYANNQSTKAIKIWCDSVCKLGNYRQKPQWGIPQIFGVL